MTLESLAVLFGTMFLVSAVPGPSDAAVAARASAFGFRHAVAMIIGILIADGVFIAIALLGLGALARSLSEWFVVVTWLCGAYLIYLGWQMLRASAAHAPSESDTSALRSGSIVASVLGGVTVTFADPKAIFFYMGLLPAFIDMHSASWRDGLAVMIVATVVISLVKGAYAGVAIRVRQMLRDPRRKARDSWVGGLLIQRIAGAVLMVAGLYLLASTFNA